ncbi:hypothetical protein [Yoonia sp.]|uniref:hypothetical protein n=1 Tax=Yoonia sp. TaxID=2212373 RepID=UPI0025E6F8F7|nr:hypothetical protein [Yoonia sp.]
MQIAFHIGANCTDEDRLLKSILRNTSALLQQGIAVPGPGKYRALLRETIQGLDGAPPSEDAREILLDAIVEEDDVKRIVLSNDNFIAIPKRVFDHGVFYPQTEGKVRGMCRLFPDDKLSFFFSIRNPVSYLQDIAQRAEAETLRDYLGPFHPLELKWSDVIRRIKRAAPDAPLHVWCTEDTPLIWEDLIRLQTGVAADTPLKGRFDVLSRIISPEGIAVLKAASMPDDRVARHDCIADLLDTYAMPDAIEEQINLPELSPELITAMSQSYEDDLALIDDMEGVDLILPFN